MYADWSDSRSRTYAGSAPPDSSVALRSRHPWCSSPFSSLPSPSPSDDSSSLLYRATRPSLVPAHHDNARIVSCKAHMMDVACHWNVA